MRILYDMCFGGGGGGGFVCFILYLYCYVNLSGSEGGIGKWHGCWNIMDSDNYTGRYWRAPHLHMS